MGKKSVYLKFVDAAGQTEQLEAHVHEEAMRMVGSKTGGRYAEYDVLLTATSTTLLAFIEEYDRLPSSDELATSTVDCLKTFVSSRILGDVENAERYVRQWLNQSGSRDGDPMFDDAADAVYTQIFLDALIEMSEKQQAKGVKVMPMIGDDGMLRAFVADGSLTMKSDPVGKDKAADLIVWATQIQQEIYDKGVENLVEADEVIDAIKTGLI